MTTSLPCFLVQISIEGSKNMGIAKNVKLMIPTVVLLLVLTLKVNCQHLPLSSRPLCISQFALVNHACAMLPFNPNPAPPVPPSPHEPGRSNLHSPNHGEGPSHSEGQGHGQSEDHGPGHGEGRGHGHNHGHGHGHGSRHRHQQTPVEEDCCRWLRQVDDECVCDLLVHLPIFLRKPSHDYTVAVDPSCSVTFSCGGRL